MEKRSEIPKFWHATVSKTTINRHTIIYNIWGEEREEENIQYQSHFNVCIWELHNASGQVASRASVNYSIFRQHLERNTFVKWKMRKRGGELVVINHGTVRSQIVRKNRLKHLFALPFTEGDFLERGPSIAQTNSLRCLLLTQGLCNEIKKRINSQWPRLQGLDL